MAPSDVAAVCALAASGLAVVLVVLLHVLEPEFDPSWRMLSEYSLGRYGVLMRVAFLALGSSAIAIAVALSQPAWPLSLPLGLLGVSPLATAFIDTDPITTPRSEASRHGLVHSVLGMVFIVAFPLCASLAGVGAAGDTSVGLVSAVGSLLPWVGLATFIASFRQASSDGSLGPEVRIGWPNRAMALSYLIWVALAAITILR
jgi:Protein of unknown function (DUF998)